MKGVEKEDNVVGCKRIDVFSDEVIFIMSGTLVKKGKSILVTGCGDPQGCETSRIPHFLGNRLTDGGEVLSLNHRPSFIPRKIPGTHFG
jgi:hypothetical protein